MYIGQKGDGLSDIPARDPNIDEVQSVSAGKFRRYHGEGIKQLLDIKTMALNFRDMFRVVAGTFQSWRLLRKLKPEVIFIKGGFVGVPVGFAAAKLHIPFITHDSDALPGLANRIIARWAVKHAVAMPKEIYAYKQGQTFTVGVPVVAEYQRVTPELQARYRQELSVPADAPMVFVIGGGLGSQRINDAVIHCVPELLQEFPNLVIVHGVGRANESVASTSYDELVSTDKRPQVQVAGYLHDVYRYSGAADVIVTRAGATNLAEFAVQGKACIVIPSPFLAGGHQLKNAKYLEEHQATEQIPEDIVMKQPELLSKMISELLHNPEHRAALGERFTSFGNPHAARDLAELLLNEVDTQK